MQDTARLLGIPEVVARLGISRAKTYDLLASGALPSVRLGSRRLVRLADLQRFIDGLS